jgi:small subunit ribosomal protein S2
MPSKPPADKKTETKTTARTWDAEGIMPELITMLEAGVHFGHERSKRNPKMERYIFMQRNRVAIIDLEHALERLKQAAAFAHQLASSPSSEILFVGTKRQARDIVRRYAEMAGQPYVTKRWLGGTITNFSTILKSIEKLEELKRTENSPQVTKLTKKEKAVRQKEIERLEEVLEGIKSLKMLPAALYVVGSHDERIAVREARRAGIPVIGITDTNADPSLVDYPIPGNDDAIRSIDLITSVIAQAILKARQPSS